MGEAVGLNGTTIVLFAFLAGCAVSMASGSSFAALFTMFPIFYPAGVALGAEPALMAGAILSGAIFGDNLAPVSDTTIISAATQRYRNRAGTADIAGVVGARFRYCIVAALIAAALFLVVGSVMHPREAVTVDLAAGAGPISLIMFVPVALLLATAFLTRDIFLAISVGLIAGTITGLAAGLIAPTDIIGVSDGAVGGFVVTGLKGVLDVVALVIAVFGIVGVLTAMGVLDRLLAALETRRWTASPRGAEAAIAISSSAASVMFGGAASASMVTVGPVVDKIGARAGLHPNRRANVMDCFSFALPVVFPVLSALLFITSQLTSGYDIAPAPSAFAIFPFVFYPLCLTAVMIFAVVSGWGRTFEGPDGAPVRKLPARTPA